MAKRTTRLGRVRKHLRAAAGELSPALPRMPNPASAVRRALEARRLRKLRRLVRRIEPETLYAELLKISA